MVEIHQGCVISTGSFAFYTKRLADFAHWLALPELRPVFERGKRPGPHAIDIKRPLQVIDFMLQNSRVPSGRIDHFFLSAFIEALHANFARPRNQTGETGDAQAALEEFHFFVVDLLDLWIDDGVKWDGKAFAFPKLLLRDVLVIFLAILDHGKLEGKPYLRGREPHAWRFPHAGAHGLDQFADFLAGNFRRSQSPGALPQDGISSVDDFKVHRACIFRAQGESCAFLWNELKRKNTCAFHTTKAAFAAGFLTFLVGMSLIDESMAAGGAFALGDKSGSLIVTKTFFNHLQNHRIARTGVF
jgi:hypothetical protein